MIINIENTRKTIKKHIIDDGFDLIVNLEKSYGSWLFDESDGRKYLDFFTMYGSIPIGYNHPKLLKHKDLLTKASLNKPANSEMYTTFLAECYNSFFKIAVPEVFKYCFFIEGGALGVENAIKASFDWKIKKNFKSKGKYEGGSMVMHLKDCFHGRTGYTLSLTNTSDSRKTDYFPIFNWPRITNPIVTFPKNEENLRKVQTLETKAINEIKNAIFKYGNKIASFILEPIQGEGGDNHFRKEFFQKIREICNEEEIILIFDEVQSGMGITGKWWAWQNNDIPPDMMCFGKKTQVCGVVSSSRVDEIDNNVFNESSRINSTWGGNLTDMVRLTIYLNIIQEEDLIRKAAITGNYLLEQLNLIQNDYSDLVSNSRGLGLMCAFDLPNTKLRDKLINSIIKNGAIIIGSGKKSVRFRPALNISEVELDQGFSIIRKSLNEIRT
tara:strand:+ start:6265 stop:7584 length:1320 start_codon:yes stop_codon:yes gene_type:complete